MVLLARSRKSRIAVDLLNVVYGEIQHEDKRLEIPYYAVDMHTSRGRRMGRGIDDFFKVASKLEREVFKNPYRERAWRILKKYGGLRSEFVRDKIVR